MKKKSKIVFVSGNFKVLHSGHLRLFNQAKKIGDKLVVGVLCDRLQTGSLFVKEKLRMNNIASASIVDEVCLINKSVAETIKKIKPNIVLKGKEHENKNNLEKKIIEDLGGKLVFSSGDSSLTTKDFLEKKIINHNKNYLFKNASSYLKRKKIDKTRLVKILNKFKKIRVLVIGDIIVDEYINCNSIGMSQEEPTIVLKPVKYKKFIGGAGIVSSHASMLGAHVTIISVLGDDNNKNFINDKLDKSNVNKLIYYDKNRNNVYKKRYRSNNRTIFKVNTYDQDSISKKLQSKILAKIKNLKDQIDLIIFSDFNYGTLPENFVEKITKLANENNIITTADSQSSSQYGYIDKFKNTDLILPTEHEARVSMRNQIDGIAVLSEKLRNATNSKHIIIKLGSDGVFIQTLENNKIIEDNIDAINQNPQDISGAGDSLLTVASLCLSIGSTIWEAGYLGSIAASIQVSREGNSPISLSDIKSLL